MRVNTWKPRFGWFVLGVLLFAAQSVAAETTVTGELVFAQRGVINVVDLATLGTRRVPNVELGGPIPLSSYRFRKVLGSLNGLFELDIDSGELHRLGTGHRPSYFRDKNLVFYTKGVGDLMHLAVFAADPSQLSRTERKIADNISSEGVTVVPTRENELVFPTRGKKGFQHLDLKLNRSTFVEGDCFPLGWRKSAQQLVCWLPETNKLALANIDGRVLEKLPTVARATPVLYIADLDSLLINAPASGFVLPERRDLYLLEIESKKTRKVLEGVALSLGDAAFVKGQQ